MGFGLFVAGSNDKRCGVRGEVVPILHTAANPQGARPKYKGDDI